MAAADVGDEEAWRNGVYRDVESGELVRDVAHQVRRAGLRRHVGHTDGRLALIAGDGSGHDQLARALRLHDPGGGPERGEYASEVDIDDPLPALVGVALERPGGIAHPLPGPALQEPGTGVDPGIRKHDVEAVVGRHRVIELALER